jgi:penicillin-binding protein 1A
MSRLIKWFYKILFGTLTLGFLLILLTVAIMQWYFFPQLPSVEPLETAESQIPLTVYSKDNVLFAEFGEYYRLPIALNKIPPLMIKAILAAEDSHFYQPFWREILRGGSPITRQLARQYLSNCDRNDNCDFNEMLLALKIEQELTQDEILTLYLNKVFFGPCAYGIEVAAQLYYGKQIQALTLAQWAMLAGLTHVRSSPNPITHPQRALIRRNQILEQMLALQFISQEAYNLAVKAPNTLKLHQWLPKTPNLYIAEMVRDYMYTHYGEAAYTKGYKVITTIDSQWQTKAVSALRNGLFRYDEQQKYRGVLAHVDLPSIDEKMDIEKIANDILATYKTQVDLIPSLVLQVNEKQIVAYSQSIGHFEISVANLVWDSSVERAKRAIKRGDIILVRAVEEDEKKDSEMTQRWQLSQIPKLEGGLVSINPNDGAITALVGGFDFDCYRKPFNRVTRLVRTAGSVFQPFVYSAALANGLTSDSIIVDVPPKFNGKVWRSSNSRKYYGRIRLRKIFLKSLNPVFVSLAKTVGLEPTFEHIAQFGFKYIRQPLYPNMSAGIVIINPLELATGYAVFANGGYLVKPYFIERIENAEGKVIYSANPLTVCRSCLADNSTKKSPTLRYAPQIITSNNAQQINAILKKMIQIELKEMNLQLKYNDIAGKSGTTHDRRNVWYAGYSPEKVTTVWVGFDNRHPFRYPKNGKTIALPIWVEFMAILKK